MKRFFKYAVITMLAAICIMTCIFASAAEYGSCENHVYPNNGEYTVVGEATCTATATMYRKCVVCGYNDIFKTPKNPDNHVLVSTDWAYNPKPNCTNGGIRYKICFDCNEIVAQEDVPADPNAHVAGEINIVVKEPTCSTEGIKAKKCRYCSGLFDYEPIAVNAENHVVTENWIVTQLPTCNEKGYLTGLCDECGRAADKRPIDPTGAHTPSEDWTVDTEPVCVRDGSKSQHCTVCDTPCNVTAIPATPDKHNFSDEYTIDSQPTCSAEGSMSKHCADCDEKTDVYSIDIAPDAHKYNDEWIITKEPTCSKTGLKHQVCTLCGKNSVSTMIATVEHTYPEEYEIIKESADGLSAQVKYTCTECGYEYVTVLVFGNNNGGGDIGDGSRDYMELVPVKDTVVKVDSDNFIVSNVKKDLTVGELMEKFSNSSIFAIYSADGRLLNEEDAITTGCRFNYSTLGGMNTNYYVSVTGDIDGDGKINAADARYILRAAAQIDNLEGAYFIAADVNLDGKVNALDARKTLRVAASLEYFLDTYER